MANRGWHTEAAARIIERYAADSERKASKTVPYMEERVKPEATRQRMKDMTPAQRANILKTVKLEEVMRTLKGKK